MNQKTTVCYVSLLLGFVLLIPAVLVAQSNIDSSTPSLFGWVNTSIGMIKPGKYDPQVGVGVSLNIQKRNHYFSAGYFYSTEILPQSLYDKSNSVSLTYHYIFKKKWWYVSSGTGLNYMWFDHYGRFDENLGIQLPNYSFAKPGIPIDFEIAVYSKSIGLGFNPGLIINNGFTARYLMINVKIGKLR